jgi:hypothetical protein
MAGSTTRTSRFAFNRTTETATAGLADIRSTGASHGAPISRNLRADCTRADGGLEPWPHRYERFR